MKVSVVVGNPKPASRTLAAAELVARGLTGVAADPVIDVITLGPALLHFGDPAVAAAVDSVCASDVLVCASPTFKATYTGTLKVFLDQFGHQALDGVFAVPLMLGAGPHHAMAPEVFLRHVLTELGAECPTRALYLLESDWQESPALEAWLPSARACLSARSRRIEVEPAKS